MKIILLFVVSFHIFILTSVEGQNESCQRRNKKVAKAVRRPCSQSCDPNIGGCGRKKVCICDHECGYSCVKEKITCRRPPNTRNLQSVIVRRKAANGSLVLVSAGRYKYNDEAEYVCKPGYKVEGQATRHLCHSRGKWTGKSVCALSCQPHNISEVRRHNMTCGGVCITNKQCSDGLKCKCNEDCGRSCVDTKIKCKVPEAPRFGSVIARTYHVSLHEKVAFQCNNGYWTDGQHSGKLVGVCRRDGKLSVDVPQCIEIRCSVPDPPRFGSVSPNVLDVSLNEIITYSCNNRYRMVNQESNQLSATCQADGTWSVGVPQCIAYQEIVLRATRPRRKNPLKATQTIDQSGSGDGSGSGSGIGSEKESRDCDGTIDDEDCQRRTHTIDSSGSGSGMEIDSRTQTVDQSGSGYGSGSGSGIGSEKGFSKSKDCDGTIDDEDCEQRTHTIDFSGSGSGMEIDSRKKTSEFSGSGSGSGSGMKIDTNCQGTEDDEDCQKDPKSNNFSGSGDGGSVDSGSGGSGSGDGSKIN